MKKLWVVGASLSVLFCLAASASANQIVYTYTVPLMTASQTTSFVIPKFNIPGGTLVDVKLKISGHVEGTAKFENLDSPGIVMMDLDALFRLMKPDCSTIVSVIPLAHTVDSAGAFDGALDYAGTSGKTYTNLSADQTDCSVLTSPSDLALFTGPGSIVLPFSINGASSGSGTGNLVLSFNTLASATVTVTYDTVPEPATLSLVGSALIGGIGFIRRRRMI